MFRVGLLATAILVSSVATAFEPATYRGGWRSKTSGHKGPMRVTLTQRCDGRYDARFTGRFAKIIPFTYKATMTPVSSDGYSTTMVSTKRLPIFGNYTMTARVTPGRVDAMYRAKSDHGTFNMTRSR